MVDTSLLDVYRESPLIASLPKLKPEDVADAVYYVLETPDHLQVNQNDYIYFLNKNLKILAG